jgi:hypothetical protein
LKSALNEKSVEVNMEKVLINSKETGDLEKLVDVAALNEEVTEENYSTKLDTVGDYSFGILKENYSTPKEITLERKTTYFACGPNCKPH